MLSRAVMNTEIKLESFIAILNRLNNRIMTVTSSIRVHNKQYSAKAMHEVF